MKQPTVFLSSTIYDFRDLRSALKFYLEAQGCRVLASEFSDFTKPLDKHSYEACLSSIHGADFFVLLVGSRIGGWYDESNRISITQREYREAYKRHQAGQLRMVNFVRTEVWNAKEDRRELVRYLQGLADVDSATKADIANYDSKFLEDADWIAAFLAEVGRNKETKVAIKGGGDAPSGNWIHVFDRFDDIVNALNTVLWNALPIEELTFKRLLRRELRGFLAQCFVKVRPGEVITPRACIEALRRVSPLRMEDRSRDVVWVDTKLWDSLSSMVVSILGVRIHPMILDEALARSTFLSFDLTSLSFIETPIYEALHRLRSEIRRFNDANTPETHAIFVGLSPKYRDEAGPKLPIQPNKLGQVLHLVDRWVNIIELAGTLLRAMDGRQFSMPDLLPDSPVDGLQKHIDAERPSEVEVEAAAAELWP